MKKRRRAFEPYLAPSRIKETAEARNQRAYPLTLVGSYISLASFVPDEDVDVVIEGTDKERIKIIYHRVLADMEKLSQEMREFNPFE